MTEIRAWWCPAIGIGVLGSKRCNVSICTQDHNPLIEKGSEKAACVEWLKALKENDLMELADELEKANI